MAVKSHPTHPHRYRHPKLHKVTFSKRAEPFVKEILNTLAQAAYQVALKTGFRGTFIVFLSDLQKALENVIHQDMVLNRNRESLRQG
jgi:hypothetical protein